ncbi:MAG: DnaD domain protein [Dehalococcoidales bacterium]|nr:DnaD domain protein [Dehalococcoidales bacterium]
MKPFGGFPARMEFTPVPNLFFSRLLAEIDDTAELKTLLCVFQAIYGKRGSPRFTTYNELTGNTGLMNSLGGGEKSAGVLRTALAMAEKRGTILHLALDREGKTEDVYFLNTPPEQQVMDKIKNGELQLPDLTFKEQTCPDMAAEMPDIFTVYEENIGLLTPMIADELREAEKLYPEVWLRDAIKRAVEENKRKWSYIQAILERWTREGKDDGTHQRNPGKTDPGKYIKGKYGHMVQR